jgi:hypothetical protein
LNEGGGEKHRRKSCGMREENVQQRLVKKKRDTEEVVIFTSEYSYTAFQ